MVMVVLIPIISQNILKMQLDRCIIVMIIIGDLLQLSYYLKRRSRCLAFFAFLTHLPTQFRLIANKDLLWPGIGGAVLS